MSLVHLSDLRPLEALVRSETRKVLRTYRELAKRQAKQHLRAQVELWPLRTLFSRAEVPWSDSHSDRLAIIRLHLRSEISRTNARHWSATPGRLTALRAAYVSERLGTRSLANAL